MKDLHLHLVNICMVCKKGAGRNSVYCSFYKHWVHKRCSGFKGKLIDTPDFKCHSCLHPPECKKEAHKFKLGSFDYKSVDKFYYLGNMLSAGGGAEASSITRIRTDRKKFRELLPPLTLTVFSHKMKGNVLCYVAVKHGQLRKKTPTDRNANGEMDE